MNTVSLTGRFTRDPDVRYTNEGKTIARFTLACDRRYKTEGGQQADFIGCVAFGKTAEFIEKYFTQGMKMELTGRIQTGSYVNNDNVRMYTTDVIAEQVGFCESKRAAGGQSNRQSNLHGNGQGGQQANDDFMSIPDDIVDELPFA